MARLHKYSRRCFACLVKISPFLLATKDEQILFKLRYAKVLSFLKEHATKYFIIFKEKKSFSFPCKWTHVLEPPLAVCCFFKAFLTIKEVLLLQERR